MQINVLHKDLLHNNSCRYQ